MELQEAMELGIPCANGLVMLVAQAKRAGELFLGKTSSDDVISPIVDSITRDTQNIILAGMPGSGKSTVGRRLAEALNRPFVDTDALMQGAADAAAAYTATDDMEKNACLKYAALRNILYRKGKTTENFSL